VNAPLTARVELELDGTVYAPGQEIVLPEGQEDREAALLAYGYADRAPVKAVAATRRRKAS
jgi:hypothetical protein